MIGPRPAWKVVVGALAMTAIAGCGGPEEELGPSNETGDGPAQSLAAEEVGFRVRVVDLRGRPLEGMVPIATKKPNAFDKPVAWGKPTDARGRGEIVLASDSALCLRAWDPEGNLFTNNYFDIPAGRRTAEKRLEIVMVEGAVLTVQLVDPDGRPAALENVGLMMFHPTKGPWWPGEGDTDGEGRVSFSPVPAGQYVIKMKAIRSGTIELPGVMIRPGETVDLGKVALQR